MKKIIALLLTLVILCSATTAFAYDMSEDAATYVAVYGLDQPFVSRVWAVTSQGRIDHVQVWDMEKGNVHCLKSWELMQPGHDYEINIKVVGVTGDIYINGVSCWHVKAYGDKGTDNRYVTGEYDLPTRRDMYRCGAAGATRGCRAYLHGDGGAGDEKSSRLGCPQPQDLFADLPRCSYSGTCDAA